MPTAKIGVIGGTGLYDIEGLAEVEEVNIDTPFGKPSDVIITGKLGGVGVAFLPRHGRDHNIIPTEVPSRANIYALKSLGVESIIAINSVGSLKEEIKQGDLVIPDQLIDRTKSRINTFFGEGIVAHIQFAEPFCPQIRQAFLPADSAGPIRGGSGGGGKCPPVWHLHSNGRSRLFHQSRIPPSPQLGVRYNRHDGAAGSQIGTRSRNLLRYYCLRNRL